MIKYNGLDEAIVGFANVWHPNGTRVERVIYSGEKIVEIYMQRDEMTEDQAIEFIEFNTDGGYVGEDTPIIVWPIEYLD
jgi:hypothetical protein